MDLAAVYSRYSFEIAQHERKLRLLEQIGALRLCGRAVDAEADTPT